MDALVKLLLRMKVHWIQSITSHCKLSADQMLEKSSFFEFNALLGRGRKKYFPSHLLQEQRAIRSIQCYTKFGYDFGWSDTAGMRKKSKGSWGSWILQCDARSMPLNIVMYVCWWSRHFGNWSAGCFYFRIGGTQSQRFNDSSREIKWDLYEDKPRIAPKKNTKNASAWKDSTVQRCAYFICFCSRQATLDEKKWDGDVGLCKSYASYFSLQVN